MIFNPIVSGGGRNVETVKATIDGFSNSIMSTPDGYVVNKYGSFEVIKGSIFVALYDSRDYPAVNGGVEQLAAASGAYIYYVTGNFSRTY